MFGGAIKLIELLGALAAAGTAGLYVWTSRSYERMTSRSADGGGEVSPLNVADVDEYVKAASKGGGRGPPFGEKLQCALLQWTATRTLNIHSEPYPLVADDDEHVQGLKRTRVANDNDKASEANASADGGSTEKQKQKPPPPIVIGTIRMGFGHHRISYAVASYATSAGDASAGKRRDVIFHDVATIGEDESSLVDGGEMAYSAASRQLTELPNPLERLLSKLTSSGGPNALRMQVLAANLMVSLMGDLDRDSPVIATHPLVGAMSVASNFTNVVNLVVDNHPQWFVVVPGALNLVQGPKLYRELMKLGVPDAELELAGHWNPRNIVETIPEATERRIRRVEDGQPLRLLIPVGGAGAQESFLVDLIKECAPLVKEGKIELLLNAGDHDHIRAAFKEALSDSGLDDYETVSDVQARDSFVERLRKEVGNSKNSKGKSTTKPVTLFAYTRSQYAAVTTTDELVPYCDVLVCKPSEMAFYAVPKLMIRRVGDHERESAVRAAEVGEGTLEASTVDEAVDEVRQFLSKPGDLIAMNRNIRKNSEIGMYDGARVAVERALERAGKLSPTLATA